MLRTLPTIGGLLFAAGAAIAQTQPPARPYEITTFGEFRAMMLRGDFTPKVTLGDAMARHPTTGVGAVAGARGEITVLDGALIVTYGKEGAHPAAHSESAALLAIGAAPEWRVLTIDRDIAPDGVEAFIGAAAKAEGIGDDTSFPFQLRGTIVRYVMHVNAAPTGGPHGMGLPMAVTIERSGEEIAGAVAGLYVSADLMGIATHGGERSHAHWVSRDGRSTAHLDAWGIKAGSALLLPKR